MLLQRESEEHNTHAIPGNNALSRTINSALQSADQQWQSPALRIRGTRVDVRGVIVLALATLGAQYVAEETEPVAQPSAIYAKEWKYERSPKDQIPSPSDDIENIYRQLNYPGAAGEFLAAHAPSQSIWLWEFPQTFRLTPAELIANGGGPCSNYSEFNGELKARFNKRAYDIVLRPPVWKPLGAWHILQVTAMASGGYTVADNENEREWEGTIQEYINKHHPGMVIFNQVSWRRCSPSFVGRISHCIRDFVPEEDMVPFTPPPPPASPPQLIASN